MLAPAHLAHPPTGPGFLPLQEMPEGTQQSQRWPQTSSPSGSASWCPDLANPSSKIFQLLACSLRAYSHPPPSHTHPLGPHLSQDGWGPVAFNSSRGPDCSALTEALGTRSRPTCGEDTVVLISEMREPRLTEFKCCPRAPWQVEWQSQAST